MEREQKEKIFREMLILNNSASWFQTEIKNVINSMQEIESSVDYDTDAYNKYQELSGKLRYLLGKGLFENRLISKLKRQIKQLK